MDIDIEARSESLRLLVAKPPLVHSSAPEGVWRTSDDCYEFLARELPAGARTVETGCGISTVLFTAWGCDHLCVVPSSEQEVIIRRYCEAEGIDDSRLRFDLRTSDVALPELMGAGPLDLAFVDGSHGFPQALLDWYYTGGRLVEGGIAVLDDVWLRQVTAGLLEFLDADPRWERIGGDWKWRAYRRLSQGGLCEEWTEQRFMKSPAQGTLRSRAIKVLPKPVRETLVKAKQRLRS